MNNDTLVNVGIVPGLASDIGKPVDPILLVAGGTIASPGTFDFLVLTGHTFANASALAGALTDGSYTIDHPTLLGGDEADFLVAYASSANSVNIADLHLHGHAAGILIGSASTAFDESVFVSDIVTLVGVSLAQLENHIDHVHLVN